MIVPKLSRFGRSVKDLVTLFDLFEGDGIALVFLDVGLDTSSSQGRLLRNIMGAFAEYESDVRADYSRAAQDHRARQGLPPTGWIAFGYRRVGKSYAIHEPEAAIVREIFDLYSGSEKMAAIARGLNAKRIPSPRNKRWAKPTIAKFLDNHHYAALLKHHDELRRRADLGPAPRGDGPGWTEFLRAQAATVLACDFFTAYTLWGRVVYVLFFIELSTRRVHLAGCTSNPDSAWVVQQARNLCFSLDQRIEPIRILSYDRDSKFSGAFDEVFSTEGIEIIETPIRSPRAKAVAERWIRTVRAECLDWLMIADERHLFRVLSIYANHYNRQRPHRGLAGAEGSRDGTVEVARGIAFFNDPSPRSSRRSHP